MIYMNLYGNGFPSNIKKINVSSRLGWCQIILTFSNNIDKMFGVLFLFVIWKFEKLENSTNMAK